MAVMFELSNPVLSSFVFHTCVCCIKILLMGGLTSLKRVNKRVFANPEDHKGFAGDKFKPKQVDEDIERVRRNHLNDLENIIPFVLVGIMYVLTGPTVQTALWHFRIFTVSRIAHTLAYQIPLPQPSRFLSHVVGLVVTSSMAIQVLCVTSW